MMGAGANLLRVRHGHDHTRVTYVELFFDLVFVFAITQLSHTLLEHLSLKGLYRGRRVCAPGWALTVAALPQKLDDGTWRVVLSSGFAGIWVVMDTRADVSFLRPEQRVRVEGTVLNFSPQSFLKAGGIHIGSGRVVKQ